MKRFSLRMAVAIALGASALIGGIGLMISSAWLITMAAQHPPISVLLIAVVLVRFFGISRSVARYGERIFSHEVVFKRLTSLRVALFEKLSAHSISFTRDLNSGSYVKSIVDDVERAQEYQLRITLPRYVAIISVTVAVFIGVWIETISVLVMVPASLALLFLVPKLIERACTRTAKKIERLEGSYSQSLNDSAHGLIEASMYGYLDRMRGVNNEQESKLLAEEKTLLKKTGRWQFLTILILGSVVISITLMADSLGKSAHLSAVQIAMLMFLPLVAFEGITAWYPNLFVAGKLVLAKQAVQVILDKPSEIFSHTATQLGEVSTLQVSDLRVAWDKDFMKPINFECKLGEVLVIRGKSGAGKSTLALGLTGLLDYSGSAQINGTEIRDIQQLDRFIVGSLQMGHIFNSSVRENLKIANPDATDEQILTILKILELDSIALDALIGEFGRPLSGGEARRLGVARALLSKAPILILDEPTEHIDDALAQRLESRITDYASTRILIVITHSGWVKSNRTVVIERE